VFLGVFAHAGCYVQHVLRALRVMLVICLNSMEKNVHDMLRFATLGVVKMKR
jgi:hypothetical protein